MNNPPRTPIGVGGHRAYVRAVRFVDGPVPFAATVGYDGTLRTHHLPGLEPGAAVHAHAMGAGALDVTADGRAITAGADGVVRFWDVTLEAILPSSEVRMPTFDADPLIETACWMPDGKSALVGVVGGSVWEIDPRSGSATLVDQEGMLSINALAPSPDGQHVYIASDECTVRRYRRVGSGWVLEHTSEQFDDHVDALALRVYPGGATLVAATHGRSLWRSDDPSGALTFVSARVARDAINALAWVGDRVLVGGDGRLVYLVDPVTFESRVLADTMRDIDGVAAASPALALLATTGGLVAVDVAAGRVSARSQDLGALSGVVTASDLVYVGQHDAGRIIVGRLTDEGGETLGVIGVPAPVSCVAANAPVFGLATGLVVRVTGLSAEPLFHADAEVEGVDAVEEEGLVLAVDRSGTLYIHSSEGVVRVQVTGWGRRLKSVRLVRVGDARLALCAGKDHRIHAVDLDDMDRGAWEITGSNVAQRTFNDILCVGDRVYAASWDREIHQLELGDREHVARVLPSLLGHTHAVERLVMVGQTLVSVSYDGTLRGWPAGAESWALQLSDLAVRRVTLSHIPGRVLTAGYDGVVREVDVCTRSVTREWQAS